MTCMRERDGSWKTFSYTCVVWRCNSNGLYQGCGSAFISSGSSISGWIRIRIQYRALMTKNWKKIQLLKKLNFSGSKTTIYLSLGLHKERPSYRRNLQLSKEAIQDFKTWTLVGYFCPPGSGSDPLTRFNPDPDPQPWILLGLIPLRLRAGGDRSRSNSSYNQEEDISRLVECMALNTTSDEESEASEASARVNYIQIPKHNFP